MADNRDQGAVLSTRTISTSAPLTGGGNLSADRTISIPKATAGTDGYLSAADWATFAAGVGFPGAVKFPNVFDAGMAAVTPDLNHQWAFSNDGNFWISTGVAVGNWRKDWGCPGQFIAGGPAGSTTNHIFVATDDNVVKIRNEAQNFHTVIWGDQCTADANLYQFAVGLGNSASGYPNLFFLSGNDKTGVGHAPDMVIAMEGTYYTDVGHNIHYLFYGNGTTLDYDFLIYTANTRIGTSALHFDHALGITQVQSCAPTPANGPGTLTIVAGAQGATVTGAGGTTFLSTFKNCRLFFCNGQAYHVLFVASNTSMTVAEPVSQTAGKTYQPYFNGATFFGITQTTQQGVHVTGASNELVINGDSTANLWLQEFGVNPSSWKVATAFGTFSITDVASNKGPFAIAQGAQNNQMLLNADGSVDLNFGGPFKIGGTQVLTTRRAGWVLPTATLSRATFDPATVTLVELAKRVAASITDSMTHGFFGT